MEDQDIRLNVGVCGKKRRLSSDDENDELNLKDEDNTPTLIKDNIHISSRESTPKIINKSIRSRRVLNSDSDASESLNNDKSFDSQLQHTSSSDISSDSSSNESSDSSLDISPKRVKEEEIKSESSSRRSRRNRSEIKKEKQTISKKKIDKKRESNKKGSRNKGKLNTRKKSNVKEKVSNSQNESSDEESTAYVPRRDRDHKQILVAAILCRWWHVLPDWPPPDTDYQTLLRERKLRLVEIDDWEDAPDIDENGFSKVFQLSNYTGVFRDSKGVAHDLRPLENKPCYSNLIKLDEDELYKLLVTALENQIKTLENNPQSNSKLISELKRELIEAQALLSRRSNKKR